MRRCSHTFDLEAWTREHDQECQVDPEDDADILEETDGRVVWRCPHEAVGEHDGEEKCVFHLPREKRPDGIDPVEEFVAIVNGEREAVEGEGRRPARFIDATFEGLEIDRERIGNGEVIDLRHARVGRMTWEVEAVDAPLDARGDVIEGEADFWDATFEDWADFRLATFESWADFQDATFEGGANFEDAIFEGRADFRHATFEGRADFPYLELDGANFQGAYLPNGNLENAELEGADLRNANLAGAILENAILTRTQLYGTDFTDARLHGTLFGDARISDATTFVERDVMWSPLRRRVPYLNKLPGVDISEAYTIIYDPRTEPVYEPENNGENDADGNGKDDREDISNHTRAAAVYQAIESLARDNAASTLASTCFAWRKDMERKRLYGDEGEGNSRRIVPWAFSWLSNLVTRYGESPYRVLVTAGAVIISCGFLYRGFNLIERTPNNSLPVTLFDALYFSTMTFTTLGYGDFRPRTWYGQFLAISETSAGVVLLALLVFVFGRRATR